MFVIIILNKWQKRDGNRIQCIQISFTFYPMFKVIDLMYLCKIIQKDLLDYCTLQSICNLHLLTPIYNIIFLIYSYLFILLCINMCVCICVNVYICVFVYVCDVYFFVCIYVCLCVRLRYKFSINKPKKQDKKQIQSDKPMSSVSSYFHSSLSPISSPLRGNH